MLYRNICHEDIRALLQTTMNREERTVDRETALKFILELADKGLAKEIIWSLESIVKEDIAVAKMKERELSEWEKDRLKEGLKKGTLTP